MKLNFREMRNRAGFTLEEAAARMSMSPSQVSRIESGTSDTGLRRTQEFAELYNCNAADLIDDRLPNANELDHVDVAILRSVLQGVEGLIAKNDLKLTTNRKVELTLSLLAAETERLKEDPNAKVDLGRYQSIIAALT